jgi:aspartate/methionine/tyrosine aminotransferase
MRLAERMDRLGPSNAFEAVARAHALEATGRHIIHLEIGEPDFDAPPNRIGCADSRERIEAALERMRAVIEPHAA